MGSPSSGSSTATASKLGPWLRLASGLGAAVLSSGCALAMVAATELQLYSRNSVTLRGEVVTNGATNVKVGLLRYFEADDNSGTFTFPSEATGSLAFTTVATASTDASHSFSIVASSSHKIADFLLMCWSDSQNDNQLGASESRSPESYVIYKVGNSFSVARASADEIVPAATPALGTWPDAGQLLFTFDLPASGAP